MVAINDKGESLASEELSDIMATKLSSAPIELTMVYATYTTITFEWSDPIDNGGTPILDFMIYWDEGNTGQAFTLLQSTTTGMNTFFIQNGLTAGEYYQFKVKAVNYIGAGPFSSYISIIAASVPLPPHSLERVLLTQTSITFTWQENADNGGSPIIDYHIYWDGGNTVLTEDQFIVSDTTSYLTLEHL